MTKGLDQYLQDAEQLRASEDGIIRSTNTSLILEVEEQVDQTSQNNLVQAKQEFIDEKESAINIPESQKIDTSYSSQWQVVSNSMSHQDIDLHVNLPDDQLQDKEKEDPMEQDTLVYNSDVSQNKCYSTAIDVIADSMTIQMGKPVIEPFTTDDVMIPNEKIGCIFVTIRLQKYLEEYAPSSEKQAFLDINYMLPLLAENRYYEHRTREYMEKLEKKSIAIQTRMYDSVAHDFYRVSDYCDNGSTSLQGQQDEQPEVVNGAENAIEHDAIDILTEYPLW